MTKTAYERLKNTGRAGIRSNKRSSLIWMQGTPRFPNPTAHQKKIGAVGKACAGEIRGIKNVAERRQKLGACVKSKY
jgi:hypothetical protein